MAFLATLFRRLQRGIIWPKLWRDRRNGCGFYQEPPHSTKCEFTHITFTWAHTHIVKEGHVVCNVNAGAREILHNLVELHYLCSHESNLLQSLQALITWSTLFMSKASWLCAAGSTLDITQPTWPHPWQLHIEWLHQRMAYLSACKWPIFKIK